MKDGIKEIIAAVFVIFVAMIDPIWSVVVAVILLVLFGVLRLRESSSEGKKEKVLNPAQVEQKRKNLETIQSLLSASSADGRSSGSMTNADVEKALGVSDATATRYLQDLEGQGIVEQVGKTGPHVTYRLK